MTAFTAKNELLRGRKRTVLLGDKTKKAESAQHIIEFPGGAIEVSRCEDGSYWAHVTVNAEQAIDDAEGRVSAIGRIVDARADYPDGVRDVKAEGLTHLAVRIEVAS